MNQGRELKILIVDFPYPDKVRGSYKFISNLIAILQLVIEKLYVISDNVDPKVLDTKKTLLVKIGISLHFLRDISPRYLSMLIWVLKSITIQIIMCYNIAKAARNVDIILFFMMHPTTEVFPMFFSKLLGKKIVKVPLGNPPRESLYFPSVYCFFQRICLYLADYYLPEYDSVYEQLEHQVKYPKKLLPASHFYIPEDSFKVLKNINSRKKVVGYIGGFRKIKGVINFVEAIGSIIDRNDEIEFLIIGDGLLKGYIENLIMKYPKEKVTLIDWVPHNELPIYLNELMLVVIPSYNETGPFIAVEAMACGTPILATEVGFLPLLVRDGETGFILQDNSPRQIAKQVLDVLGNCNLQRVVDDAKNLVSERYVISATVDRWSNTLNFITEGTEIE